MSLCQPHAMLLGTLAALFVAWGAQSAEPSPAQTPLRIGIATAPKTLDPALAADAAGARILHLTHPALLRWDDAYRPTGLAAERCTQPQPKRVVCELKANQRYTSGAPFTAASVATWLKALQENARSPLSGLLQGISFTAPTAVRLELALPAPNREILSQLLTIPLADPTSPTHGLGPYTAHADPATGHVTLMPRWPEHQTQLPTLRFQPLSDGATRVLQLRQGELDVLAHDLNPGLVQYARREAPRRGWEVRAMPSSSTTYMVVNFRHPLLGQAPVREALSLALNRPLLRRALLDDQATPATSLLPPGHAALWPAPEDPYDPLGAEAMLEESPQPDGHVLIPGPDGRRFSLTLLTSTDAFSQRLAQAIQAQWAEIGVHVELEAQEWAAFHSRVQEGRFDLALLTWTGEQPIGFYEGVFHSTMTPPNGLNRGHVNDPQLDALLEAMKAAPTEAEAQRLAVQVQQRVAALRPYLTLWRRHHVLVQGAGIRGCTMPPSGALTGLTQCRRVAAQTGEGDE